MAIDEHKDYTSADVLNVDDALSLAVIGYRVRAKDMQPGAYIDYQFAGWRIHFPGGSSSGWSRRSHDETVEWHVVDEPEPAKPEPSKWGKAIPNSVKVSHVEPPVGDVLVMGDGGQWGSANPAEALRTVAVDVAAKAGVGVDHAAFDRAAEELAKPVPAPNVGKWGKALPPSKDKWGRSS